MWHFLAPAMTTKKFFVSFYTGAFALFVGLTFTAEGATALAVAITALIAAIFTGIVNLITVLQAKAKVEEASKKTDVLLGKAEALHTTATKIENATNGTLHTMTSANKVMQEKIDGLETLIASMVAAQQTQAAAVTEAGKLMPPGVAIPAGPIGPAGPTGPPGTPGTTGQPGATLPEIHEEIKAVAELSTDTNATAHRIEDTVKPT